MTLIELVLVFGILAIAFGMLTSTLVASSRQRSVNRESALAAEAAHDMFENMMNTEFDQLYRMFNADPADDPGGAGTAPGHRFGVTGLAALPESPDGLVGEVILPSLSPVAGAWELREDYVDPDLGMPRDLNGDSLIDDLDHRDDYLLLPVRVELEWKGRYGPRRMSVSVMMADLRKGGS